MKNAKEYIYLLNVTFSIKVTNIEIPKAKAGSQPTCRIGGIRYLKQTISSYKVQTECKIK